MGPDEVRTFNLQVVTPVERLLLLQLTILVRVLVVYSNVLSVFVALLTMHFLSDRGACYLTASDLFPFLFQITC